MKIKLEFITEFDAQHGACHMQDLGYTVKLMGKALLVDKPQPADLALMMATYRAFTVDLEESEKCA